MSLDPGQLKQSAMQQCGLSRFGVAPLDEGLERYCWSLSHEAALDDHGLAMAGQSVVATLVERLKVEDYLGRHVEVLHQPLAPIVMIVGMPRTGTTALSQYLSEDPRVRSIRRWEAAELTPPEPGHNGEDPRIERTRQSFATRDRELPWLQSMLPVAYDDTAEHGPLLGLTFLNLQLPVRHRVPTYSAWMLGQDMTPAYAYLAKVLKLLQWNDPRQLWSLKNPPDLFALDAIDTVFPDARFIWAHRNPIESIASVCSLAAALRSSAGAAVSKGEIGTTLASFWAEGVHRATVLRERLGDSRFLDVNQRDLAADIVGTMCSVYNQLGIPFTQQYRIELERRVTEKPPGRHGRHRYDLADFAIDAARLRATFAGYIDRFNVPMSQEPV
jgi:hypothetical protein